VLIKRGLLYAIAAAALVLCTLIGVQWVQIKSLGADLADAREAKTLADVNVLRLGAEIETMSAEIEGYKTDVAALDAKRAQAKADADAQRVEYESKIKSIRADLAATPEEIRQKMIRHATR